MKTGIALLSQHVHIAAALMRSFTQGAFCSVQQPRCLSFPMHGNPLLIVREGGRRGVQNCKPHSDSVRLKCHFIISASALFPLLILSQDVSSDMYSISASPFSVFLCPSRKKDYVAHDILTLVPNFPQQIVRIKQIINFKYFNISQFLIGQGSRHISQQASVKFMLRCVHGLKHFCSVFSLLSSCGIRLFNCCSFVCAFACFLFCWEPLILSESVKTLHAVGFLQAPQLIPASRKYLSIDIQSFLTKTHIQFAFG